MADKREFEGVWASVQARLADIFAMGAPHVRQNLATLAGVLADDRAALTMLANTIGDAADDVAQKQGQAAYDLLRSGLEERRRLRPAQRDKLDQAICSRLGERTGQWETGAAVPELIQLGLPLSALPVTAFTEAAMAEAARLPTEGALARDASTGVRARERLRRMAKAEQDAPPWWREAFRENARQKFEHLTSAERRAILLALIQEASELVWPADGLPALADDAGLQRAAALGRGSPMRRALRAGWGALTAAIIVNAVLILSTVVAGLPLDPNDQLLQNLFVATVFQTFFGTLAGGLAAWLYVPTAGRPMSRVQRAKQLALPPVAAGIASLPILYFGQLFVGAPAKANLPIMFLGAAAAITLMLLPLPRLALQAMRQRRENRETWYILLAMAPAGLLLMLSAVVAHLLDLPGVGLLPMLIVTLAATTNSVWPVEERNLPAALRRRRLQGEPPYPTAHLASAVFAAGLIVAFLIGAVLSSRPQKVSVPPALLTQEVSELEVPGGRPVALLLPAEPPVFLSRTEVYLPEFTSTRVLLVRKAGKAWRLAGFSGEPLRGGGAPVEICVGCGGYATFDQRLAAEMPRLRENSDDATRIQLIPGRRPPAAVEARLQPGTGRPITGGAPLNFDLPSWAQGIALSGSRTGFVIMRLDGDRPIHVEAQGGLDVERRSSDSDILYESVQSDTSIPLEPGRYQICVYFAPVDADACSPRESVRKRAWVMARRSAKVSLIAPQP